MNDSSASSAASTERALARIRGIVEHLESLDAPTAAALLPTLPDFAWSAMFTPADRADLIEDLITAGRRSLSLNDPTDFNAMWKGWEHSAEAMGDPEMLAKLTGPIDHSRTIPLPRP